MKSIGCRERSYVRVSFSLSLSLSLAETPGGKELAEASIRVTKIPALCPVSLLLSDLNPID